MKVLLVNKFYYPEIGGIETVTQILAEGLIERECSVEVLACARRGPEQEEVIRGVPVHKAASFGIVWSMPISLDFLLKFRRMAALADVIFLQHPFPLADLAAYLFARKKPLVVFYHSDVQRQRIAALLFSVMLKRTLRRASKIIVTSARIAQRSKHLQPVLDKVVVVPIGIVPRDPAPAPDVLRQAQQIRSEIVEPLVLAVGRLVRYKGFEYLIRAIRECKGHLLIIGSGGLERELKKIAEYENLGDRVHFKAVPRTETLAPYYHACDVFVLPSIATTETFGIVQVEAMAAGKPVVNTLLETAVCDVSVDGETGFSVPPRDSQAMGQAIGRLLADDHLRAQMGEAARDRAVRLYSRERFCDEVHRELLRVVEDREVVAQPASGRAPDE